MKKRYFITGTDTDAGKTRVSECLLASAAQQGLSTLGLKPVAAGAEQVDGEWQNEDAQRLIQASSVKLPYQSVNPVLLRAAMAPHIAAERENKRLTAQNITGYCRGTLMTGQADFTLIEGAGGWRVPLNYRETLADVVKALNLEVILVVGMKLGCLNHALLTAEAIKRDGLVLRGWVANSVQPDMEGLTENIHTLERMMPAPLIGVLPHLAEGAQAPEQWVNPALFR
ncbi:MAG: dethiobiotin synthase [Reinekea sp.]|nr:dethiobiotin synthase [Reinekea sp.]